MNRFKEKPFYLADDDIDWVKETLNKMTLEEKIGQLFFPICLSKDHNYLKYNILKNNPGGVFFRQGEAHEIATSYNFLQKESKIPLLTAANLERGGDGAIDSGTCFGQQMQIAATNDKNNAYILGKISAKEGKAVGINYAFAPVCDIDLNNHNPITNVRTYGSDVNTVATFATNYVKACNEEGMITSIKHFPGDGVDERDQHIVTSINSLSKEMWDKTYGYVYKTLIDSGTKTVMVGHIALPAYQDKDKYLPASLSYELVTKLLKEKLGFNGLVITDATPMVGFCAALPRNIAVPQAIMAGCDMFLFNKDYDEDYNFMLEGYKNGLLTEKRLNEAVSTILSLKASIKLHKKDNQTTEDMLEVIGNSKHQEAARLCAENAITLVKDKEKILPINANKTKKVLFEILGDSNSNERVCNTFLKAMEKEGFEMIKYEKEVFDFSKHLPFDSVKTFKEKYDLVIYLGNVENASNKTTNRINWYTLFGLGNNLPWFVKEVPTMFISLQNPYHLLDVPMIGTYINCYSNHDIMIESVVKAITGQIKFKGKSPIDPFLNEDYLKDL